MYQDLLQHHDGVGRVGSRLSAGRLSSVVDAKHDDDSTLVAGLTKSTRRPGKNPVMALTDVDEVEDVEMIGKGTEAQV